MAGHLTLVRHYRPLIALDRRRRVGLVGWMLLHVFVAIELGWILRPFVGDPALERVFIRATAFDENPHLVLFWTVAAFDPNIQDPHRIVRCPAAPDVLWCQHHNGVFRSTDDAKNWVEIEKVPPSVFGFTVAVHPVDPDTAWFVPAIKDEVRTPVDGRVVVARTRDGGRSFEVLSRGLPGPHAYDLVFRHALDVDASGERLAFGSTTGALWVSEDQGDSWATVSAHLPPIRAVRFA